MHSPEPSSSAASVRSETAASSNNAIGPAAFTLVTAAIVLWNTIYIDRAIAALTRNGAAAEPDLLKYLSPLGWEHINLTGNYQWNGKRPTQGKFRPLPTSGHP